MISSPKIFYSNFVTDTPYCFTPGALTIFKEKQKLSFFVYC